MLTLREKHEYEQEIAQLKSELLAAKEFYAKENVQLRKSKEHYKRKYLKLKG